MEKHWRTGDLPLNVWFCSYNFALHSPFCCHDHRQLKLICPKIFRQIFRITLAFAYGVGQPAGKKNYAKTDAVLLDAAAVQWRTATYLTWRIISWWRTKSVNEDGSSSNTYQATMHSTVSWSHILLFNAYILDKGSTDQACSSGFYIRIAWKSTERPCFLQKHSLSFLQGLRSLKNWLL